MQFTDVPPYYDSAFTDLIKESKDSISDLLPSEWCEQNRILTSDMTQFPGPFSYKRTPYLKGVVDCFSPSHPARVIAVMKGSGIGFSVGVIEAAIGFIISQNPGNIIYLVGNTELTKDAMLKVDNLIDNSGLRKLIRPNTTRAKNNRTGDTEMRKEFPLGSLVMGSATQHQKLMQRHVPFIFADDYDAVKSASREDGSTKLLIEQRMTAYYHKMKLAFISTPRLKKTSNIEPIYESGNQCKWHIPCPCCGELIVLEWETKMDGSEDDKAGIYWKLDGNDRLIEDSVGYICQKCGGFFDESNKDELNLAGEWIPTAEASQPGYWSFHIPSLYAPHGMYDWTHYVRNYLDACPPKQDRKEDLYKTFRNLTLGLTYEEVGQAIPANALMKNIRPYEIGIIPEKLSIADGNGRIVLLTCAADLNGTLDDARLDYEVLAHSESGSTYSVIHGSIGTFVPLEGTKKIKEDRRHWTYEMFKSNSVWPEFEKVLGTIFPKDNGKRMKIVMTGVDTGHYTVQAYQYIDHTNFFVVGLKGDKEHKFTSIDANSAKFKASAERSKLYLLQVNRIKDTLAQLIRLKFDPGNDERQPPGYMNYPTPSQGLYLYMNYFKHYEAEQSIPQEKDGIMTGYRWEKINSVAQNHFWDVRVYGITLRDIFVWLLGKEEKRKDFSWEDYVEMITKSK